MMTDLFDMWFSTPDMKTPRYTVNDNNEIEVICPGTKKEDINITIDSGEVVINIGKKWTKHFIFRSPVTEDQVVAKYENGILTVKVNKKEKEEKIIKIQID